MAAEDLLPLTMLLEGRRLAVLTGAGVSTESGIPDYRGDKTRARARQPMRFVEFTSTEAARKRYWARAAVGYARVASAQPNTGHVALAALEQHGVSGGTITQNVDGLHAAAGSRVVVELHGSLSRVVCLGCGTLEPRDVVQQRLEEQNPGWSQDSATALPDGDAELDRARHEDWLRHFRPPSCLSCGGDLKPDVVFFGENVPTPRVEAAFSMLDEADALVVVGSSLAVFSGYRFALRAKEQRKAIVIISLGVTRADHLATLKLDARCGEVLPHLCSALLQGRAQLSDGDRP